MSYDVVQMLIIALAVTASAAYATTHLAPKALRNSRKRLALFLLHPRRDARLRSLGRRLAPAPATAATCGTGACSSCAPAK